MCASVVDEGDCGTVFRWSTRRRNSRVHVPRLNRYAPVAPFALTLGIR